MPKGMGSSTRKLCKALEIVHYLKWTVDSLAEVDIQHIVYAANKMHLLSYGRFFFDEEYVVGPDGPESLSISKVLERTEEWREPNLRRLSKSDQECLDRAIEHFLADPHQLAQSCRDETWQKLRPGASMPLLDIANMADPSGCLTEYLLS